MNNEQKQEFLKFLETQEEKETIHDISFRLLCFSYEDRMPKSWIGTTQPVDSAPFKSMLVFPLINLEVPFLTTVKDLKELIKNV